MKKFQYRLETVLEVRRKKEEQEQGKYQALAAAVRAIENRIRETEENRTRLMNETAQELHGVPDVNHWKRSLTYADQVARLIIGLKANREQADKDRLAQRERLLEAVKRRKVLETLKEKAHQQFTWEEGLREQLEMDDWASINHQASKDVIKR
jgi:flagellar protein FliJ